MRITEAGTGSISKGLYENILYPHRHFLTDFIMAFKIKKVRPLFTGVITTARKYVGQQYASEGSVIIDTRKLDGTLNPYQIVYSVGGTVRDVKEGDVVKINFSRYALAQHRPGKVDAAENVQSDDLKWAYEIPKITIDGIDYLFIQDRDIDYIVEDYEVDEGGLLQ